MRQCGGCTACCKLLPVLEIKKPAMTRCDHQRTGKGCAIYAKRPASCRVWSCMWLRDPLTADLSRPDRSHYVIDMLPDFVTSVNDDTGEREHIRVVQVWVSPTHRDAHRDPALRAYLEIRGQIDGTMALIRYGQEEAFLLCPPSLNTEGIWVEKHTKLTTQEEHTAEEIAIAWRG